LLERSEDGWTGRLADELPAIFNWAYSLDRNEARDAVLNFSSKDEVQHLSSIDQWAEQNLVLGSRAPVGGKFKSGKDLTESTRRGLLYPAYLAWCERNDAQAEHLNMFSVGLIRSLEDRYPGRTFTKVHTRTGTAIKGIELSPKAYDPKNG